MGDQIITLFTQYLTQHLRLEDSVFRWSGPAFLVLLQRDEPLERIRRELAPIPLAGKASVAIDKFNAFVSSKVAVGA